MLGKPHVLSFVLLLSVGAAAAEPQPISLWPNGAPGSEGKTGDETMRVGPGGDHIVSNVHRPSSTPYLPSRETATGAAVVIAPGGGHSELWMDHEGYNVAKWLSDHGIAGFILKYRLARAKDSTYTIEGHSLADIQRALARPAPGAEPRSRVGRRSGAHRRDRLLGGWRVGSACGDAL